MMMSRLCVFSLASVLSNSINLFDFPCCVGWNRANTTRADPKVKFYVNAFAVADDFYCTGELIIGIYRNLSEVSLILSDNFIGSDKIIG